MDADTLNVLRSAAVRTIKSLYGTPEGEYGPTLFVSHHLKELGTGYWLKSVGVEEPSPNQILNSLVLVNSWRSGKSEDVDTLDFGLPGDASDYLLSVRFQDDGQVQSVSMES